MERSFDTPLGRMCLTEESGRLTRFEWRCGGEEETSLLLDAQRQLAEYFAGHRRSFDLPLAPAGTAFQHRVWDALLDIPWGETRAYGQIAAAIGNPKACRAVGTANHCNPLPILIPCHRVIGSGGALTGYGGGLERKQFLLSLEAGK